MSRADELVTRRQPDGSYRRERRGEPTVEIRTDPHTGLHHVDYYVGGYRLCKVVSSSYRWLWRAERAARRWLEAERRGPTVRRVE